MQMIRHLKRPPRITITDLQRSQNIDQLQLRDRIGFQIQSLQNLQFDMNRSPSIQRIINWQSYFYEHIDVIPPDKILYSDTSTLMNLSRGLIEWNLNFQEKYGFMPDLHASEMGYQLSQDLNIFHEARIGTRLLLLNYIDNTFYSDVNPISLLIDAYMNVYNLAIREYSFCPEFQINGIPIHDYFEIHKIPSFQGIPSYLYYVIFEILKNAIRATMEKDIISTIDIITEVSDRRLIITIRDYGVGIDDSSINQIWNYFYTTAERSFDRVQSIEELERFNSSPPLAGFGCGLPMSRLIMQYFGGDLTVNSNVGLGTETCLIFNIR